MGAPSKGKPNSHMLQSMGEDTQKDPNDPTQPLMSSAVKTGNTTVDEGIATAATHAKAGADFADTAIGGGFHQGLCGCWTENLVPGGLCIFCCPTVVAATLEAEMNGRTAYFSEMICAPNPFSQRVRIRDKYEMHPSGWQFTDLLSAVCCAYCFMSQNVVEVASREGRTPVWFHCPPNFGDSKVDPPQMPEMTQNTGH